MPCYDDRNSIQIINGVDPEYKAEAERLSVRCQEMTRLLCSVGESILHDEPVSAEVLAWLDEHAQVDSEREEFKAKKDVGKWRMNKKKEYSRMLNEGFAFVNSLVGGDEEYSRMEYLSEYIFRFVTHDSEMSKLFGRKAIEVCVTFTKEKTFEYIKDPENYRWYLIMCNMPFFSDKIEWDGSMRGAWLKVSPHRKMTFNGLGLLLDGEQLSENMKFDAFEWENFIDSMVDFSKEE